MKTKQEEKNLGLLVRKFELLSYFLLFYSSFSVLLIPAIFIYIMSGTTNNKPHFLGTKVTVLGGAGGIGQAFCLLLKQSPLITSLAIFDVVGAAGVAADLSHINTRCEVKGYGADQLNESLEHADIVVITAGRAQKPGMTREDLFNVNAPIIANLAAAIAKTCPKAMICIISNPVNHFVPICSEVMSRHGVLDTRRIFGVLSLDAMRSALFAAELKKLEQSHVHVPVIGGHSVASTVPVFSQMRPAVEFSLEEQTALTHRVKNALYEVINAKAGAGSATLSMAHAAYHFTISLLEAMHGVPGVVESAYVRSDVIPDCKYFANPLLLGVSCLS